MFGLLERGRLKMYRSTLSQTLTDAGANGDVFYTAGVLQGLIAISKLVQQLAPGSGFEIRRSVEETIDNIPSAALPHVDGFLLSNVKPSGFSELPLYQSATLLGGLVFARIVEVSRPQLASQANAFKNDALRFLEPQFRAGLEIMASMPQEAV